MENVTISCRKNNDSTTDFCSHFDYTYQLEELIHPIKNSNILVLVHGYSGTFESVQKAYNKISENVKSFDYCIHFYWPGSWSKTIGYVLAEQRTTTAANFLIDLINTIDKSNNVTVQAHSLGSNITVKMYHSINKSNLKVILCAPAVDHDIEVKAPIKVLTTEKDTVLKYAYRMVPYNWFSPALGYKGPKNKNNQNITHIPMNFVNGHSDYINHEKYYQVLEDK